MNAPLRRDACPGLSLPMPTGDGLLVRITPADRITPDAWIALCEAARQHGNGTIEVTARGSIQVRGLSPRSAPLFASAIAALRIATEGVPVISDPLIDDPSACLDAANVAAYVRAAIADAQLALAPKVSVVIDGGGCLHLDALVADVRLRAVPSGHGPRLHVALGGDARSATPLGSIAPAAAGDAVVRLLRVMAGRTNARAADIVRTDGIAAFHAVVEHCIETAPPPPRRPHADAVGRHPLRDGLLAVGLAVAFGHSQADTVKELARLATAHGARWMRPAPGRALLLTGLTAAAASAILDAAERLGFIVRPHDPRRSIAACPGTPLCGSGLIPARALAAEIAPHIAPSSGDIAIHVSGCAKGCAHSRPCGLTIVGTAQGCGIVHRGDARTAPHRHVEPARLVAEVARIMGKGGHG